MNDTRIVELRKARGWTQERLAQESGVTVRTIQRLEAGNDSSLETISQIAKALEVPVRDLFGDVVNSGFGKAVDDLASRAAEQQVRRNSVRRSYGSLYHGVGLVLTLAVVVGFVSDILPTVGVLLIPAYWAGGYLISTFLLRAVVDPWLDTKYPLSRRVETGVH